MYYLKYRPQTIDELDNTHVKHELSALLEVDNFPHALLFAGPKGTGKTSTARIVAKTINCQQNYYAGKSDIKAPCGLCKNCAAISAGTSLDVVEIDAASNRKVEDVRDFKANIYYAPVHNRYKVYIIDEVHMLTKESFNTLLKTLEEPPSNTIFILATTEKDALPKTILSRCITIVFPRGNRADLINMLKRIIAGEKLIADEAALGLIADSSDGSFRDAAKLLEQASAYKELTGEIVKKMLGVTSEGDGLLSLIIAKKQSDALKQIAAFSENGGSIKVLIESLLRELHNTLLQQSDAKNTIPKSHNLTLPQTARLIKLLTEAHILMKQTPIESLPLEIAVVDYCSSDI